MNLLLDTHVFIWMDSSPDKLSQVVKDHITDSSNTIYLSLVSAWEIQIKVQLGKLSLSSGLQETIESQQISNSIQILPIELPHILTLNQLPNHHKDPFDRLLIAQANVESMKLITIDAKIQQYQVNWLW